MTGYCSDFHNVKCSNIYSLKDEYNNLYPIILRIDNNYFWTTIWCFDPPQGDKICVVLTLDISVHTIYRTAIL